MARLLVVQGLRENDDKQPSTRLAFTGFACGGENGLENHRTHGFPTPRAGLLGAGGLCAAEHVMRAPWQSIMAGSFFSDLADIAPKAAYFAPTSKAPGGRTLTRAWKLAGWHQNSDRNPLPPH
jgi:hypothetical protein